MAIKIVMLPLEMSANKKQEAMAMMEATVSTSLKHPNIVQVGSGLLPAYRLGPASPDGEEHVVAMV